nr:hypothetical protein [Tanacetum cinerariifolium]
MWRSIEKGPYVRPMNPDPDNTTKQIIEPLSKMTEINKKQYIANVRVMNYLLQAIPNDIYNSVDACKTAQEICLLGHSNASSSQSHASPSYSHSPQPHYVTHPSSVFDYEEDYQGELQGDSQKDRLTTAMMLLARAISQKFSTPTNNCLRYGGNGNRNAGRQNRNQSLNAGNGLTQNDENNHIVPRTESNLGKANLQCYNCNEKSHYVCDCQKPRVRDAKLTAAVIMMARIQLADDDAVTEPNYDAKAVSEVNASHNMIPKGVHEHKNYGKRKTVITTFDDDQIDSNIIFDDPYIENNDGSAEHDSNAHD